MSLQAAIRKTIARGVKTVLGVFLLTFYIAGTSQFEVLHELFHRHSHAVVHSEVQEMDPCHREIYHDDNSGGCGHHAHIVVADKCGFCDLIFHVDQIFLSALEEKALLLATAELSFSSSTFVGTCQAIDSSRAPPVA